MRITISMPEVFVARLDELVRKTGLNRSELLRRAVDQYREGVKP